MNDATDKNKDKNETAKSFAGMIANKIIDVIKAVPIIGFVASFFIDGQKDNIANAIEPMVGGAMTNAMSALPQGEQKQSEKSVVPLETPVVANTAKDKPRGVPK